MKSYVLFCRVKQYLTRIFKCWINFLEIKSARDGIRTHEPTKRQDVLTKKDESSPKLAVSLS